MNVISHNASQSFGGSTSPKLAQSPFGYRPADKSDSPEDYIEKRARNHEAVRKCRDKKRSEQTDKEKKLIYLERGVFALLFVFVT